MATPVHIHTTLPVRLGALLVAEQLRSTPAVLSAAATADAITAVAALLESGGFRTRALPTLEARLPEGDEIGHVVVRWRGDEDATGWPDMTIWVLAMPKTDDTSTLVLLSPRHPGFDMSTGRVDKVWRDRIARTAVRSFGSALRRLLETSAPAIHRVEQTRFEPVLAPVGPPSKDQP